MSGKRGIAIGLIAVLMVTVFAGLSSGTSTTNNLPMPYGTRDLTEQYNPDNGQYHANTNRFFGVRVSDNQWYTFVDPGTESVDYFNSEYASSDVNKNGMEGIRHKPPDTQDMNYFQFVKGGIGSPPEVYTWALINGHWVTVPVSGTIENHNKGVTGIIGVKINSYDRGPNDNPIVIITIMTMYQDNYINGYSQDYISQHHGQLTSDDPYTTNGYLHTEVYAKKINDDTKATSVKWIPADNGSGDDGMNACPGDKISYENPDDNLIGDVAKDEIRYLGEFAIDQVKSAAVDVYGPAALGAELGGGLLVTGINSYINHTSKYKPYPYKQDSPGGDSTVAYYDWSAHPTDQNHVVVQSYTYNAIAWYPEEKYTYNKNHVLGLKLWATFWYGEATDTDAADDRQVSLTTLPIYIYLIPKGLGTGLPIQPVPSNYAGSYDVSSDAYKDPPTKFTATVNKELTLKTVDVAYGFNDANYLSHVPIQYDFYYQTHSGWYHHNTTKDNGKIATFAHEWTSCGDYEVKVRARAKIDGSWHPWSPWSKTITVEVKDAFSSGPSAPYAGGSTFYVDGTGHATITFRTSSRTYSGCDIQYKFIWGDGSSTTTGWYSSGSTAQATHSYSKGTYYVKVEAIAKTGITKYSSSTKITVESAPTPPPGGGGGGGSCVNPYTPILMADRTYKFAKDIQIGDEVITYNFTTGEYENGTVEKITITHEDEEYVINGMLGIAKDQEVWTSRGWVEAQNLTTYDWIYNAYTGKWMQVYDINVIQENIDMYDFHISNNQNYIGWMYLLEDWGGIHAC